MLPVAQLAGSALYLVDKYFSYDMEIFVPQSQVATLEALGAPTTTPVPVSATLTVGDTAQQISGTCRSLQAGKPTGSGPPAPNAECDFSSISLLTINDRIPSIFHGMAASSPTFNATATFTAAFEPTPIVPPAPIDGGGASYGACSSTPSVLLTASNSVNFTGGITIDSTGTNLYYGYRSYDPGLRISTESGIMDLNLVSGVSRTKIVSATTVRNGTGPRFQRPRNR